MHQDPHHRTTVAPFIASEIERFFIAPKLKDYESLSGASRKLSHEIVTCKALIDYLLKFNFHEANKIIFFVDALWDHLPALQVLSLSVTQQQRKPNIARISTKHNKQKKDWKSMTDILLLDSSARSYKDVRKFLLRNSEEENLLANLLAQSLKKGTGTLGLSEEKKSTSSRKKVFLLFFEITPFYISPFFFFIIIVIRKLNLSPKFEKKQKLPSLDTFKEDFSAHFAVALPDLFSRFKTDAEVLSSIVEIPKLMTWDSLAVLKSHKVAFIRNIDKTQPGFKFLPSKDFDTVPQVISDIISAEVNQDLLEKSCSTLGYLYKHESLATDLTVVVRELVDNIIDQITEYNGQLTVRFPFYRSSRKIQIGLHRRSKQARVFLKKK